MVKDSQDWKWSSLHARLHGSGEEKVILSPWPIEVPGKWLDLVNAPQTAAEEQDMQTCLKRSRPYGSAKWQEKTAKSMGVLSSLRDVGRPKKVP